MRKKHREGKEMKERRRERGRRRERIGIYLTRPLKTISGERAAQRVRPDGLIV